MEVTIMLAGGVEGVIYNRWVILLVPLLLNGALGPSQVFQLDIINLLGVHHQGIIT
jgi:hypothetical protein